MVYNLYSIAPSAAIPIAYSEPGKVCGIADIYGASVDNNTVIIDAMASQPSTQN